MIELITDVGRFKVVASDKNYSAFVVTQKKTDPKYPLLPCREGYNYPDRDTIERTYKCIKIGETFYTIEPIIEI